MNMVQNLMDRLRPLVGFKGWDFCVLWKLSDDQRYLEWMDCCCGGTDQSGGEELQFSALSATLPCRDGIFHHPRTSPCELLSQLPTALSLDESGIHAEALISNMARWLNFSNSSGSTLLENLNQYAQETVGTRALIPVPGALIELFVAKQVPEDQEVIDIVTSQYSILMSHQEAMESANFMMNTEENHEHQKDHDHHQIIDMNQFQPPPISPATALETLNLSSSYDFSASVDRIGGLCSSSSPMNLLQHFSYTNDDENRTAKSNGGMFFEGEDQNGGGINPKDNNNTTVHHNHQEEGEFGDSLLAGKEQQGNNNNNDKDSIKQEMNGRSDSVSDCSDQNGEDDQQQQFGGSKFRRKNGRPEAKNLQAERRRRKRLNGRLYDLRALVPMISDLKKASIIGDAIEFVKELKRQAKELEEELEANSDDEELSRRNNSCHNNVNNNNINNNNIGSSFGAQVVLNETGDGVIPSSVNVVGNQDWETSNCNEKGQQQQQQMEVQVEVAQIDGNGFFVKVFCEHRPGGFVRLLEALDSLGLEVTNANVTSCKSLVSNVFRVQKKDSEMVQADYVRDSLLELTRDPPSRTWSEVHHHQVKAGDSSENGNGMMMMMMDHDHLIHDHHHNQGLVLQNGGGHLMNSNQHYLHQLHG
ncbi:unnamed protein product [Linum tenue]|uniref:Uncharacterized protein n=1 Tax=Linum tenue TaxID=586396 RepID=A0AAV0GV78_9ROSI|nr:unnamed protein product [Linum tenue]